MKFAWQSNPLLSNFDATPFCGTHGAPDTIARSRGLSRVKLSRRDEASTNTDNNFVGAEMLTPG